MSDKKSGAALVVGGGIGGMQTALDLAESGIKVYLLEKEPCIGGVMAQLDKTFPTNDCSMCIMAPKLVEVGRHKDIEIITLADIQKIEGSPGNFQVRIKKRARYIDEEKCTGCGECVENCPISIPDLYNQSLSEKKAINRKYPQAIPNYFAIEKLGQSPCRSTCPAGQKVQGYIALIREKRYEEAYQVITRDNPFPSVCGRICNHRCEEECTRGKVDEPVAIMSLKRFIADWAFKNQVKPKTPENKNIKKQKAKKVAIIGSGPAGLTAAKDLSEKGYKVTIFESLPVIGGMMRVGIPTFRLPGQRLDWDIKNILNDGIEVKTGKKINSIDKLLTEGYNSVFIATGAHAGKKLPIPGADLPDVLLNTQFLRDIALGKKVTVAKNTVVLGGGNVAMDVARSALRCGAENVQVVCLESRKQMPAHDWEIEEAEKEGIEIHPSYTFLEILSEKSRVTGIKCIKVNFKGFDANGRPDMDILPGTEQIFKAQTIIFAIGQVPEIPFINQGIEINKRGMIKVDYETLATSRAGVFAGGDVISGTQFVIDAVAAGHKAAISIERYLTGKPLKQPEIIINQVNLTKQEIIERITSHDKRQTMKVIPLKERQSFKEVEVGFSEQMALKEANRCLNCGICSECLLCVETCKADAIDHNMQPESIIDISIGAIILAPGLDTFDVTLKNEYGYRQHPNIITSIEFERILSASGPFVGHVVRPSDHSPPKKVAFIQCVGSRDNQHHYCSSVCCMYAIKEAIIAREHDNNVESTLFYMDIRAHGKDFERYYERAKHEYNVKFKRARIAYIIQHGNTDDLEIQYENEQGHIEIEVFQLVVLSIGFMANGRLRRLGNNLDLPLNQYGFIATEHYSSVETKVPGIFTCGPAQEPKDIPETVTQASAAAGAVAEILAESRFSQIKDKVFPKERDISKEDIRIGVFICHCGINIGGTVDVPQVVEYAKSLPHVVYAEHNLYTCSQDTQSNIKDVIKEHKLNRVVVASCTPRTHEPLFQETIREAGLNPHLFSMANIRDQCSWIHMKLPLEATVKAKDLVKMAAAKAALLKPLPSILLDITQSVLVIGGGAAGMSAALSLARQGFKVHLVEKNGRLGGNLLKVHYSTDGRETMLLLARMIREIEDNANIKIYLNSQVKDSSGFVGNYKTILQGKNGKTEEIEHGVVIIATGAQESVPDEYLYKIDKRVKTGQEFEDLLKHNQNNGKQLPDNVVFIQCVGSREEDHMYCSRLCCSETVKNALLLKQKKSTAQVTVLYRDIRTYGFMEKYYEEARDAGVLFVRYDMEHKPQVSKNGKGLVVKVKDLQIMQQTTIHPDMIVLASRIDPNPGNEKLSQFFKVPLNRDGFFLEAHVKLRPVDFATEGIFLAGMAHNPKNLVESMAQGRAAAARAATIISKEKIEANATIAFVDEDICIGCGICVSGCAYNALSLQKNKDGVLVSTVNQVMCKGCGSCASACPSGAMDQKGFLRGQIFAEIDAVLSK